MWMRLIIITFVSLLAFSPAHGQNVRLDQNTAAIKTGGVYFATTEAEVVAAQSNSAVTSVVNTAPWSMTASRTLTKPLRCEAGAIITTTGYTLTLSSGFEAGNYQCFAGAGTVVHSKTERILPQWRGALGDASTDDSSAISYTALDAAASVTTHRKPIVYFPPSAGYAIASAVVFGKNINVQMDSHIIYTGSSNVTALTIGESTYANISMYMDHRVRVYRSNFSDWSSEASVGVKFINQYYSKIDITDASRFTIGAYMIGDGAGFVYNTITLGAIAHNKIGLKCTNANSGWCNENLFLSGEITVGSGVNTGQTRYGIVITSDDGSYIVNNNNVFIKPSLENVSTQTAYGIHFEHAIQNRVFGCRLEGTQYGIMYSNASYYNYVDINYAAYTSNVVDNATIKGNNLEILPGGYLNRQASQRALFSVPDLLSVASYFDGSSTVRFSGCSIKSSSGTTIYESSSLLSLDFSDRYVTIPGSRAVGVMVDTNNVKDFVWTSDQYSTTGGRVIVQCFDASGNVLDGASTQYASGPGIYWSTYFGGVYINGSDGTTAISFNVSSDVKKIWVGVAGGTASATIKGFSLYTKNMYSANVWAGESSAQKTGRYASAAPSAGTWVVGDRVINSSPASGQPKAWVCTVAGTPGTWVSEGNL